MFSSNKSLRLAHMVLTFPERVCVTVVRAVLQRGPLINFTTHWGKKQMPPVVLTINVMFTENSALMRTWEVQKTPSLKLYECNVIRQGAV